MSEFIPSKLRQELGRHPSGVGRAGIDVPLELPAVPRRVVRHGAAVDGRPDLERREAKVVERGGGGGKADAALAAGQVAGAPEHERAGGGTDDGGATRDRTAAVERHADAGGVELSDAAVDARGPPHNAGGGGTDPVAQLVHRLDQVARAAGDGDDRGDAGADGDGRKVRRRHRSSGRKRKPRAASASGPTLAGGGAAACGKRRRAHSEGGGHPGKVRNRDGGFMDRWLAGKPRADRHAPADKRGARRAKKKRLAAGAAGLDLGVVSTLPGVVLRSDAEMWPLAPERVSAAASAATRPSGAGGRLLQGNFNDDAVTRVVVAATVKWLGRFLRAVQTASRRTAPGPGDIVVSDDRRAIHFAAMRHTESALLQRPAYRPHPNPREVFPDHVYAALPLLFDDPGIVPRQAPVGRPQPWLRRRLFEFMVMYGQGRHPEPRKSTAFRIPAYAL